MPKKTPQELREWYQKFAKELYEKVQIDVTRKEDLGRIKNYTITEWDVDKPIDPVSEFTYVYMPHDGINYDIPAPDMADFSKYGQWMMDNLDPNLSEKQLQELYDQSCNGTLMVTQPFGSMGCSRMVLTDADGSIIITATSNAYLGQDKSEKIPVGQEMPEPIPVVKEPNPADFGRPEKPVAPKNMEPGWLSRLGHRLGIETDYTKLLRYQEELVQYNRVMRAWEKRPTGKAAYDLAVEKRQAYVQEVATLQANPYFKFVSIQHGWINRIMNMDESTEANTKYVDFLDVERIFLDSQHNRTPQAKVADELVALREQLSFAENTELTVQNLMGHDPHPEQLTTWIDRGVFNPATFKPEPYELPLDPNSEDFDFIGEEQLEALEKSWKDLAAVAGFAAMADSEIAGKPTVDGLSLEDSASMNYPAIMSNLFVLGIPKGAQEIARVADARQLAKEALYAYAGGEPQQMGQLLARSLRMTLQETASMNNLNSNQAIGTLHLISKLVTNLDNHPDVLEASGLNPEELERARGFAALNKVLIDGIQGRKALLEHATGKNTVSPAELEQAGKSALLASYVIRENLLDPGFDINQNLMDENWVGAVQDQLAEKVGLTEILSSNKGITDAFYSNAEVGKLTADLAVASKIDPKENTLELGNRPIQNQPFHIK